MQNDLRRRTTLTYSKLELIVLKSLNTNLKEKEKITTWTL